MASPVKTSASEAAAFLIYIGIVVLTFFSPILRIQPLAPTPLTAQLLSATESLSPPGSEYAELKPLLPSNEKIAFIMDYPFSPYGRGIEKLYRAQSFMVPMVLSHEPGWRAAILDCTNHFIADQRLHETGYRLLLPLGDGRGIAAKN